MNTKLVRCVFFSVKRKIWQSIINDMHSINMINFRKNANCPSSQDLLAFQKDELSSEIGTLIKEHINICEFCETEVEFYTHYPQSEEKVKAETIPLPLYELAEALLSNRRQEFSVLDNLFSKNQGLELKKA